MKIVAIVQARMNSTRLPNKVMQSIGGTPLIGVLLGRLSASEQIKQIVLATSVDPRNDPLVEYVESLGYAVFRGSESDVLGRYYLAAKAHRADAVVRITGDCPLIDCKVVDRVVEAFFQAKADYASNVDPPTFPDGLDTEVFSFAALERAEQQAVLQQHREHVTPFIRESGEFLKINVTNATDLSGARWTVDEPEDLQLVNRIFDYFHPVRNFDLQAVASLLAQSPELVQINSKHTRNAGALMGSGQKLWQRAKRVIPGGNMLLSKRAEMFLPEHWPAYFSKAKGCQVWDLDGREYTDMSIMGIGTNTLGYGHPEVDEAVMKTVRDGNMSTLNCPEEVYLAEKLVEMHPWADMVRLARTGGEANAIAIRIARAATGKDRVAICGYHGWHDWYLSANLGDEKHLDGHLLPGLEPNGVPRNLRGTVFPFSYNNFQELAKLVTEQDIGVVKMEVSRNMGPEEGYLENVRDLCSSRGIVLIFDECTSGFRQSYGGLHKCYSVEPDIAMFGKALGNGYAITAVVGRQQVMEAAQTTFISSTFWTERIGPTAALKTLEIMERIKSWETITRIGNTIIERWKALATRFGLPINISGLPSLTSFAIPSANMLKYKTLITQEMLKKGFLASNAVYTCIDHSPEVLDRYFDALAPIFGRIAEFEGGAKMDLALDGPVCHAGFKRLN